MGCLVVSEGGILVKGAPPYELPDQIEPQFVAALFSKEPGEEGFIGEIALSIPKKEKERLRKGCKWLGGDLWHMYCQHASRWAGLVNGDNKWHLSDFVVAYEAEIARGPSDGIWAQKVMITTSNVRFAETPRGLFSFPEFSWHYGQNIVDYIGAFQSTEAKRLDEVKRHISSELVYKKLSAVDPHGNVITQKFAGLESIAPKDWRLPKGYKFLDVDED